MLDVLNGVCKLLFTFMALTGFCLTQQLKAQQQNNYTYIREQIRGN